MRFSNPRLRLLLLRKKLCNGGELPCHGAASSKFADAAAAATGEMAIGDEANGDKGERGLLVLERCGVVLAPRRGCFDGSDMLRGRLSCVLDRVRLNSFSMCFSMSLSSATLSVIACVSCSLPVLTFCSSTKLSDRRCFSCSRSTSLRFSAIAHITTRVSTRVRYRHHHRTSTTSESVASCCKVPSASCCAWFSVLSRVLSASLHRL